jgi:hypothetical protein
MAKSNYIILLIFVAFVVCCKQEPETVKSKYKYLEPEYGKVSLQRTDSVLDYHLNDTSYNDIESMNVFADDGVEYISFFDRRSEALLIYRTSSSGMIARIPLRRFIKKEKLYKTTVYLKNFDSILITNKTRLHLYDSSGHLKHSIPFLVEPKNAKASLDNASPPIIVGEKIFTGVRPSIFDEKLKAYKNWKVLYGFTFRNDSATLEYNLPDIYSKHLYGYQYLHSYYCYNKNMRFIFSFAADSNIYETNLKNYHIAYLAKSSFQEEPPKWKQEGGDKDEGAKNYLTHQAYGPVFYDPFRNRYLRVAKKKISEADYATKNRSREQTIIIFDDKFRIIGESPIDKEINLNTLFFTNDGSLYARINWRDEYALHFVRLEYAEGKNINKLTSK